MSGYRVHATCTKPGLAIPYLTLGMKGAGHMILDLRAIPNTPGVREVVISSEQLYQVLEGKTLDLTRSGCKLRFEAVGDELRIRLNPESSEELLLVTWLAEFALAWNMLGQIGSRH